MESREQFVSYAAAQIMAQRPLRSNAEDDRLLKVEADMAVDRAVALADSLENSGLAPWNNEPKPDLLFTSVAVVNVQTPTSLAVLLRDIAGKLPPNSGVPPGMIEVGFRPAKVRPGNGLVLPS